MITIVCITFLLYKAKIGNDDILSAFLLVALVEFTFELIAFAGWVSR